MSITGHQAGWGGCSGDNIKVWGMMTATISHSCQWWVGASNRSNGPSLLEPERYEHKHNQQDLIKATGNHLSF